MIPLHRPFYGVGTVIRATLFPRMEAKELRRLEVAHAVACGCEDAVWLPSARAGIAWALRAACGPDTNIIGPAFTCSVVHEAMVRSGAYPQIIDAASDSFEMDPTTLRAAQEGDYALVLSEPYGHAYDLATLAKGAPGSDLASIDTGSGTRRTGEQRSATPKIRIVDSALAVPHPKLFARLKGNDFAVVSFGAGKTAYSGWGAMGFTRDAALANMVRKIRDAMGVASSSKLTRKRGLSIGLRTAAQHPLIFSATRKLWYLGKAFRSKRGHGTSVPPPPTAAPISGFPAAWSDDKTCDAEWRLPSTRVDRGLALQNLLTAEVVQNKRLELARRYQINLTGSKGLRLPPVSPFALSHYTVRVDAGIRTRLKDELYRRGVYTISLWTFSPHLDPREFPNAALICSEVVNLPLSPWMSVEQVDEVCEKLLTSLRLFI